MSTAGVGQSNLSEFRIGDILPLDLGSSFTMSKFSFKNLVSKFKASFATLKIAEDDLVVL